VGDPEETGMGSADVKWDTSSLFCFLGLGGVPLVYETVKG
jgi:hypothetical protein